MHCRVDCDLCRSFKNCRTCCAAAARISVSHHVELGARGLQVTKIAVAPAVLVIEFLLFRKTAAPRVMAAIALVCLGVGLSTLTDVKMGTSSRGLAVGAAAVAATALYQVPCAEVPGGHWHLLQPGVQNPCWPHCET